MKLCLQPVDLWAAKESCFRGAGYYILIKDDKERPLYFFGIMCTDELFEIWPGKCKYEI